MAVKMERIEKIHAIFYGKLSITGCWINLGENEGPGWVKNYFKVSGLVSWM